MGIKYKIAVWLILSGIVFSACDLFEVRGFFLSYESADQRFEQSMDWNETHPFKEITVTADDYTLFAMGDDHVGGTENLDLFLNEAIRANAVAAVMVGDLTSGHVEDFDTFEQHLPDTDSLLSFQIVGNHDLYFDGWKQYYSLFGSSTYFFSVTTPEASDLYICLDSGSGTLGSKQLDWFKTILENERPNYRRCVVFTHNNLFRIKHTTSTNPFVEEIRVLAELCIKHDINMIVTGHDHTKNVVVLGNTTHITMDALKDDYENAGYFKMDITGGDIGYEFVNF